MGGELIRSENFKMLINMSLWYSKVEFSKSQSAMMTVKRR